MSGCNSAVFFGSGGGVVFCRRIRGQVSNRDRASNTGAVITLCAVFDTPTTHLTLLCDSNPQLSCSFCKYCRTEDFLYTI